MKTVLDLIRKADKEFKVALAGLYYEEIEPELYDYCISTDQVLPKNVIEKGRNNILLPHIIHIVLIVSLTHLHFRILQKPHGFHYIR